jgi:hypothetical protein
MGLHEPSMGSDLACRNRQGPGAQADPPSSPEAAGPRVGAGLDGLPGTGEAALGRSLQKAGGTRRPLPIVLLRGLLPLSAGHNDDQADRQARQDHQSARQHPKCQRCDLAPHLNHLLHGRTGELTGRTYRLAGFGLYDGTTPDVCRRRPEHQPAGQRLHLRLGVVHKHLTELALEVPTELLTTLLRVGQLAPELLA